MLKIKLARFGKKNQPHYRIIVNEARSKRDGKYVAALGHYAPTQTPKVLEVDLEAYKKWVSQGAQPTETVANLVKRYESGNPFPEKKPRPSKKALAKAAAEAEAKAAADEEAKTTAEAPASETTEAEETTKTETTEAAPAAEVQDTKEETAKEE